MKIFFAAAGVALLASNLALNPACLAQTEVICGQPLNAPLRSGGLLTVDSRPEGIEIVGVDRDSIQVTCTSNDMEAARRVLLRFSGSPDHARLAITGDSVKNGNLHVRVEVPRKTSLVLRMSAGEVTVKDVEGDKDFDLYAGQITISSARAWNYQSVDASVDIGEVSAPVYGADTGGFFRRFTKKTADGEYHLHAHVMTGEIDLVGAKAHTNDSKAD
uniref:Adhesin domain-containing protein n=1 Tax=mine drainage metagenome TaxID=410659 RepID=E6PXC4_9ZZZZ